MKRHSVRTLIGLSLASLFCSCSMMQPRINLRLPEELPPSYSSTSTNGTLRTEWWKTFKSQELNDLVSQAFSGSPSLAQTAARFRQARASAIGRSAASFPSLSASAGVSRSEEQTTGEDGSTTKLSLDSYSLGLAATYELDLWGRVHSVRSSADLNTKASFLDLETAAMSLSARIAELWIQIIEAKGQLLLVSRQIDTSSKTLDILKERATKSSTSLLDVYQQEQLLRTSEARLPAAKQTLELLRNELAVLLGKHAGTAPEVSAESLPDIPPFPGNGIPADLLTNRPDVRAQQLRLKAAGWDVASARADSLPAIRLSAKYDVRSGNTSTLFDNWISNLAAGLAAPLIDGGQKRSEVERSKAALDETLARYREVILSAFKNVQDSLIREERTDETVSALTRQLESSRKALDEASSRYRMGNTGYLSVLTALRAVYQTEQSLLAAESTLLQARIALHRALGGTWTQETAETAATRDFMKNTESIKDMRNE